MVIVLFVILGVKTLVVGTVTVLGVEASDLGGNEDVLINWSDNGVVEVVLGVDNRVKMCVLTVVEAVLLGFRGEVFV